MKFKFTKTKATIKDSYDGFSAYIFWYLFSALLLWVGLLLLNLFEVGYWQCFGLIFAGRQIRGLIMRPGRDHDQKEVLKKPYEAIRLQQLNLLGENGGMVVSSKPANPQDPIVLDFEGIRYYSANEDAEIFYKHIKTPEDV